jgi:hypothetical protein
VFTYVQWDSPLTLVMELALSVMVIAGIMFVARLVNSRARPPSGGPQDTDAENDEL